MALLDRTRDTALIASENRVEFEEVFEQYAHSVHHFFARRGFPPEDCRDLTQDTFLHAYRGFARFRRDTDVKIWLLSIATNVWKNALRSRQTAKRSAVKTVSLDALPYEAAPDEQAQGLPEPNGAGSPLRSVLVEESRRRLRAAIEELPPGMRYCVKLRVQRDLKYREIAAILQVSVETVKAQLFRARERLKEILAEYSDFHEDG